MNQAAQSQVKNKAKLWTKPGLAKLGALIRSSREAKGLTLRDAEKFIFQRIGIKISYRTIDSVEDADSEPKYNTLAAIAASGIVDEKDIDDFIAIAAELDVENMNPLVQLIENHLIQNDLTLSDFSKASGVTLGDLHTIMQGEQSTKDRKFETNLRIICGHLVNPLTGIRFPTLEELLDYCGMQRDIGTGNIEQTHLIKNGVH